MIAIEKKGRGVSRMYGKVISASTSKELGNYMKKTISEEAEITTDGWIFYKSPGKYFPHIKHGLSGKKGSNFPDLHRVIMGFKGWLRGMHHQVENLQAYLDEYSYRFNGRQMKVEIFENLIEKMIKAPSMMTKQL